MVEYIGGKKKHNGSRGSLSAIHNNQMELDSVVFNNRVKIYELATLADFLISQGQYPRSGGDVLKMSLTVFYEYLVNTGKGRVYELNEAKRFCQRQGLDTGSRRNVKVIGQNLEAYTTPVRSEQSEEIKLAVAWYEFREAERAKGVEASYEEWLAARSKSIKVECPAGYLAESIQDDLAVPKDDDSLLGALEAGKPKLEETEDEAETPQV